MKTGIELIAEERQEQIVKHGFDARHDEGESFNLTNAAVFVLTGDEIYYPESWEVKWKNKFMGKNYKDSLIAAGALIAAELDRLQNTEK